MPVILDKPFGPNTYQGLLVLTRRPGVSQGHQVHREKMVEGVQKAAGEKDLAHGKKSV